MTDAIIDASELESSGKSLNQHSWLTDEERARDTTPLLAKDKTNSIQWRRKKNESSKEGSAGDSSNSGGAAPSYSALLDSGDDARARAYVTKTLFGEVRNCQRFGWVEWFFIIVAIVSMIGIVGISVERFIFIHKTFRNMTPDFSSGSGDSNQLYCNHWSCLNDFIFAVVVLANLFFCIYYCFNGLLRERPFEMIGYAVTMLLLCVYIIINYFVEGEQDDVFRLVRLLLVCIFGPQNILLALVVQYRMGFLVLNAIGSNKQLTRAYHIRSLHLTVQMFNIQILVNVLILSWVKAGHFTGTGEKVLLPVLIVYMIVISYLGWVAAVWEKRVLALAWNFLVLVSLGYYVFKIINIGVHWSYYEEVFTDYYTYGQTAHTHFLYIAIVMLIACVFGMLTCVIMSLLMLTVLSNFGKGLKERVPPPCCVGDHGDSETTIAKS